MFRQVPFTLCILRPNRQPRRAKRHRNPSTQQLHPYPCGRDQHQVILFRCRSGDPTGGTFTLSSIAAIHVNPATTEMFRHWAISGEQTGILPPAIWLTVIVVTSNTPPASVSLTTVGGDPTLGTEGYLLSLTPWLPVTLRLSAHWLFRNLDDPLDAAWWRLKKTPSNPSLDFSYRPSAISRYASGEARSWTWRGTTVARVGARIDEIALLQINMVPAMCNLSDNQGWRIYINSWPNLYDLW